MPLPLWWTAACKVTATIMLLTCSPFLPWEVCTSCIWGRAADNFLSSEASGEESPLGQILRADKTAGSPSPKKWNNLSLQLPAAHLQMVAAETHLGWVCSKPEQPISMELLASPGWEWPSLLVCSSKSQTRLFYLAVKSFPPVRWWYGEKSVALHYKPIKKGKRAI